VQVSSYGYQLASFTGVATSTLSVYYHLQDLCHWALQMLTISNSSKWFNCRSAVLLKMMNPVFRHTNVYEKRDVEVEIAVLCSSTHEVFTRVSEDQCALHL
jgi:hypothetical protein